MKHLLAHCSFILIAFAGSLTADPAAQPQMSITEGTADSWNFDWEGIAGRTYFFQYSQDLVNWEYAPFIDYGEGIHSYGMSCSTDKMFFRLLYTDPAAENPPSTDGDGTTGFSNISPDDDADGLTNAQELALGTNPNNRDSDGDGVNDGDDADPREPAINWKRSAEPGYVFYPIEGYNNAIHGDFVMVNNHNQILCSKAVWDKGTWTVLQGTPGQSCVYLNTQTEDMCGIHVPIEVWQAQPTSIADNGTIAGYSPGNTFWPNTPMQTIPLVWSSAVAPPVLPGSPTYIENIPYSANAWAFTNRKMVVTDVNGVVNDQDAVVTVTGGDYDGSWSTPRTVIARHYGAITPNPSLFSQNFSYSDNNPCFTSTSRDGTCAGFGSTAGVPWAWIGSSDGSGAPQTITSQNTSVPTYYPNVLQDDIDFSGGSATCLGTTPPTGVGPNAQERPVISIGDSILIHDGSKWVKSKSLQDANISYGPYNYSYSRGAAISKYGTVLCTKNNESAIWRNGKITKILDLCPQLRDIGYGSAPYPLSPSCYDINDQGVILISGGLLLPVDITVRKNTDTDTPPTGLCVKQGDTITFDFNGSAPASAFPLAASTLKWQINQLKQNGDLAGWVDVPGEGCELDYNTPTAGIFQVKAILTPPGQAPFEFVYVRKKDVKFATNSGNKYQDLHRAGAPDYFGVVDSDWQIRLRDKVVSNLGSTYYAEATTCVIYGEKVVGKDLPKCNIFVYHKCNDVEAYVPLIVKSHWWVTTGPDLPPNAIDWWNDNTHRVDSFANEIITPDIPGWVSPTEMPQPGWVVSRARIFDHLPDYVAKNPPLYEAHVGVMDYDGSWVSAGSLNVNKYCHLKTPLYQPPNFKKFVGNN